MNSFRGSKVSSLITSALLLTIFPVVLNSSASDTRKEPWQGIASGHFSVSGEKIPLKYSFALLEKDPLDEAATVISVLLTNYPLSREELDVSSLYSAMKKNQPGILYKTDTDGKTNYEVIVHPKLEGGGTQRSGVVAGRMELSKSDANNIAGEIRDDSKWSSWLSENDFEYAVTVTFKAPLLKSK